MKKRLLIAVGILLAVPLLLLGAAALFLDPIVRSQVEKSASSALKVPARLDRASVRWSGQASLGRFEIDNPSGYTEPRSVAFERVEVAVKPSALLRSRVDIAEVAVVKPAMTLEFKGTKSNLSVLMDNLSAGRDPASSGGKKFLIRKLRIDDAAVTFRSDLLGGGSRTFTLPSLTLENVGTAEGGASMGEILREILQTLAAAALKEGEGLLPSKLLDTLRSDLRDLPARARDEFRRRAEEQLKSKSLDPAELEKKLRDRLEHKTAD